MTRNLKLFGLALLAVIALGGLAAQGAIANVEHTFTSPVEPTELTGSGGTHEWKLGKATMKCKKVALTGFLALKNADQMHLTPEFSACELITPLGTYPVTAMNTGCETAVDSDTSLDPKTGKENAWVSLDCGMGESNALEFWAEVEEGENVYFQFFDTHPKNVPVNQELHGATFEGLGEGLGPYGIVVSLHVSGLKFLCTNEFCEQIGLKQGTNENGTTTGLYFVWGYSDAEHKNKVSLGITSP
ncbi:MAG TPA: hypothetical protein VFJ57_02225 [Solirubrobacterales bacterium]|nr:hypothetical protein [Solirubrobacterales bacterium]